MSKTAHLQPGLLQFLKQLKTNNNREWFQKNKDRYESDVRQPLLKFIEAFGPRLAKISPHFVANPSKVGGSLFRIHRDTRFSHDKGPYKTYAGVQFRHERAKDVHAPGLLPSHRAPAGFYRGWDLASRFGHVEAAARRHRRESSQMEMSQIGQGLRREIRTGRRLAEARTQGLRPGPPVDRRSSTQGLHRGD